LIGLMNSIILFLFRTPVHDAAVHTVVPQSPAPPEDALAMTLPKT